MVATSTTQFSTSLTLSNCGANKTLLAGDWLRIGATAPWQLVMVTEDAAADGSGVMTVNFRHMLRFGGTAKTIILEKPAGSYILTETRQEFPRVPGQAMPPLSLQFEEVWE